MKTCITCKIEKSEGDFGFNGWTNVSGIKTLRGRCRKCDNARKMERHKADREAILAKRREIRALDPDKARRQCREWNAQNPEKSKKSDWVKRLKRYGITIEDWDRMFVEQNGRCAVCKEVVERLCVDHDHVSGKVRGLLSLTCNFAAGALKDSVLLAESLIQYLKLNGK